MNTINTSIKIDKKNVTGKAYKEEREKAIFLGGFLCLITAFLCAKSELADDAVRESLRLCANTVIPSLFPFMILNSLWVQSGFAAWIGGKLSRLTGAVFGISACGTPFLLGILGGFPLGAECICAMVGKGDCRKDEGERMLAFCSNTGPSFLIAGIGGAMFGSTKPV